MSNIWPEPDVDKYSTEQREQRMGEWQFHVGLSGILSFSLGCLFGTFICLVVILWLL